MSTITHRKKYLIGATIILACLTLWWTVSSPKHEVRYTVTDLGVLPGDMASYASDINNSGQIVGISGEPHIISGVEDGSGFIWSATGGMAKLGDRMSKLRMSDRGEVVGIVVPKGKEPHTFFWDSSGKVQLLGRFQHFGNRYAPAINSIGQVSWTQRKGHGDGASFSALIWNASRGLSELALDSDNEISTRDMNERGVVVGRVWNATGEWTAGLWSNEEGLRLISQPSPDTKVIPRRMNNRDQVVGVIKTKEKRVHAFLWSEGNMTVVENLGREQVGFMDINEKGQAVGFSTVWAGELKRSLSEKVRRPLKDLGKIGVTIWNLIQFGITEEEYAIAILWEEGVVVDLNLLIAPNSGWKLYWATAINDAGQIVGKGYIDGKHRPFLLTPIEDETTNTLH